MRYGSSWIRGDSRKRAAVVSAFELVVFFVDVVTPVRASRGQWPSVEEI